MNGLRNPTLFNLSTDTVMRTQNQKQALSMNSSAVRRQACSYIQEQDSLESPGIEAQYLKGWALQSDWSLHLVLPLGKEFLPVSYR